MNKKIIALLLVVALAVSGAFAFGIGAMNSNVAGTGALTFALDGHQGLYLGVGYDSWNGGGIAVSGEYKFWEWNFLNNVGGFFNWGLQAGAGANVSLGFGNGFAIGAGVYGFFGTNIYLDFSKNFGVEFFGQWQPNFFITLFPFGWNWSRLWGGYASGVRFWF